MASADFSSMMKTIKGEDGDETASSLSFLKGLSASKYDCSFTLIGWEFATVRFWLVDNYNRKIGPLINIKFKTKFDYYANYLYYSWDRILTDLLTWKDLSPVFWQTRIFQDFCPFLQKRSNIEIHESNFWKKFIGSFICKRDKSSKII